MRLAPRSRLGREGVEWMQEGGLHLLEKEGLGLADEAYGVNGVQSL